MQRWAQTFLIAVCLTFAFAAATTTSAVAQVTWEDDKDTDKPKRKKCEDGKSRTDDTKGNCCWAGQAWNGAACVGTPTSCPVGMAADSKQQTCLYPGCKEGMTLLIEHKACCWPGQAYSNNQAKCVGVPACPENHLADGEDCRYIPPNQDGDALADKDDKCPHEAEDVDGFEDDDGCPEPDNDRDTVADAEDQCPDQAEDMDGFQDEDGCPEMDNDADNIVDTEDQCPDQAEDMDGVEDGDGCPDGDNDRDGIADAEDICPEEAEDANGYFDDDGCPDQHVVDAEFDRDVMVVSGSVVGGVGLAMGVAGVLLHFDAEGMRHDIENASVDGGGAKQIDQPEALSMEEDANFKDTVGAVLSISGGVLVVTGVVLLSVGLVQDIPEVGVSTDGETTQVYWQTRF